MARDADCGVLIFFVKLRGLKIGTLTSALKNLRLQVKVGHRLLSLSDCDSVLSERCRQTNSQDFLQITILRDYYF